MPWWGWLLIGLAVIIVPIKFKVLKIIMEKSRQKNRAVDED
jgi:hypothetical protein